MHFFFDWDANFLLSEPKGTEEGLKNHHRQLIGFILFVLCRVPDGTLVYWLYSHGTARTSSSCTVLCKVTSLSGLGCVYGIKGCLFPITNNRVSCIRLPD